MRIIPAGTIRPAQHSEAYYTAFSGVSLYEAKRSDNEFFYLPIEFAYGIAPIQKRSDKDIRTIKRRLPRASRAQL
jgi:hypothetical protein